MHPSHYGRICPIETPEGPNIGLINSMSTYARINNFGFIETPYRKVKNGKVSKDIGYLTADQEENEVIAQANNPLDKVGKFTGERVTARYRGDFLEVEPEKATLMDVSPKQLVSIAASLIPFLEHDDANRALMGSNMQRQGVPLLTAESPLVGTGMEGKAARDSRAVVVSEGPGKVAAATAEIIVVTKDGELHVSEQQFLSEPRKLKSEPNKGVYVYPLRKFMRSNSGTCINQRPIVRKGQKVKEGDVLADGPCTENGELAIGKNVLVAFMPWNGYNFEDAITISERVVKDDVYTSIHIEEFEVTARDTKLGPEEITRDIPNAGEEALRNLNHRGVVRIGAEVKPGDILVGKITPKSETDLAPEEKLLRAIFGEKAADVKDSSLKVPSGTFGIVMDIKISSRTEAEQEKLSPSDNRRQIKQIKEDYRNQSEDLRSQLTESLSNILLGEKIPLNVKNSETGDVIIPANRKITKTLLRRLSSVHRYVDIPPSPVRIKVFEIIEGYENKFKDLDDDRDRKIEAIEHGDPIDQGAIKNVRVFVAKKQKIRVGDKMAGRHGNKGVVAKIVAEEDMPFLPDGTPIEICLNPLGVPSRMNVGQILETHLGWACAGLGRQIGEVMEAVNRSGNHDELRKTFKSLYSKEQYDEAIADLDNDELIELAGNMRQGIPVATPVFDGANEANIIEMLESAGLQTSGQVSLVDGRTGDTFDRQVTVGYIYMLKLHHLVDDKIHARSIGPYSLVTQQPLGGKAQFGGQRFGEMEVWALQAYGAAYTLREMLTVKSDDVAGRTKVYESIVRGDDTFEAGIPESFNVLVKELKALGLNVDLMQKEV